LQRSWKILSPCGILGYGFPKASLDAGLREKPDVIAVDAGSTDAGPHKLGAGVAIVSRMAAKKDLQLLVDGALNGGIPLIIGSAGGSGARVHVEWTLSILEEILALRGGERPKMAVIWADIPGEAVEEAIGQGKVHPMSANIPELTREAVRETTRIVAQMGEEPILEALRQGAQIIVCGRAYDPAPFAAAGIFAGFDPALCYHLGKILECGALCCEPGSAKDCIMGVLHEDSFEVYALNEARKCTPTSVAAHTFYEKDHPYLLHGPGIVLDLSGCTFTQSGRAVRVRGSRLARTDTYQIKLEGARLRAYRTFVIAGARDPLFIGQIDAIERAVIEQVQEYYEEIPKTDYRINFYNYGIDAVMGSLEPARDLPHEVGLLFEVVAGTQQLASAICASVRSTLLHYGYPGRKSTAGNLAFPFAPSDVEFGAVYEFSVYHLMDVGDGLENFPIEWR
jgi:hypothetical protein